MAHRFLRRNKRKSGSFKKLDSETNKYIPLLGTWLIDMALMLNWYQPSSPRVWPDIFSDSDFCAMTGMEPVDDDADDDDQPRRITISHCRNLLLKQREQLQQMKLPSNLPLFKNVDLLTGMLDLTEADQAVLTFALAISIFTEFHAALCPRNEKSTTPSLYRLLAELTGIKERELQHSLDQDSILMTTGLVKMVRQTCDLEDKISTMNGLQEIMLESHKNVDQLVARFMHRASPASLNLEQFPHLSKEREVLSSYLKNAVINNTIGVNILIHGKPGVGKNQFVQALAEELHVDLYEVAFANHNGDPIKGEDRLRAYALCQRLLARNRRSMLLFDEIEDVFSSGNSLFSMMFGGDEDEQSDTSRNGKAWINRTMENNPVPAVWISNKIGQIDKAYLRRFDYSVSFPTPPHSIRVSMARHHLDCFEAPLSWVERLAANEEITPAQFERAAKVARTGSPKDTTRARELVEQVLSRSTSLLGQRNLPQRNIVRTGYSLEWLNTDLPVAKLVEGIKRKARGTFCFYGAAGTGKSELARYMADQIGKPLIIKRASDILGMYLGQSEQNIAAMFAQAREQDAVLVLDEADSFLADRRDAQRSWEVTQVNELLTQMEAFEGIFVCTTNLMNRLDQASLRRFAFKVRFDPLKAEQREALFRQELVRLGGDEAECAAWESQVARLEQLTPGDFAVAARQFDLWDEPATAVRLYDILKKECEVKGAAPRKIGFGQ